LLRRENNKYLSYLKKDIWDLGLYRTCLPIHSKGLFVADQEYKLMKNSMQHFDYQLSHSTSICAKWLGCYWK